MPATLHSSHADHAHEGEHAAHDARDAHADPAGGAHEHHGKHEGHHTEDFRRRFWVSLVLTVPLVVTSHMVMDWFGYELELPAQAWLAPLLGTFLYLWAGRPFLVGGYREARDRQPGMMLLIAMAITVAYVASLATSLGWFDLEFWWELGALITVMLLGHWLEMRALGQAQDALGALAALLPDEADRILPEGGTETVAVADLHVGDLVLVRSGGRVPADGEVTEGRAEVDESMITGESRPVPRAQGDAVVAGTVATDSALRIRVTAVGDDTALAGIGRMVAEATASRSRAQALADRAAALLFYVAVAAAVATGAVWLALGQPDEAVVRVVTVLVISCPHALGLAIPLTTALASALAARNGILVKDRLALEASRTVDTVLFDKTGTLTKGEHAVVGVAADRPGDEDRVLALAAAVEADSEHPLARALVQAAEARGLDVPTASGFRSLTGRGVTAEVEGDALSVGGPALLREGSRTLPESLAGAVGGWTDRGSAVLYLLAQDRVLGAFALEDEVRPEAWEAVQALRALGRRSILLTGDARQVAEAVGADVGVDEVIAEVLPEDKSAEVAAQQARGRRVAMVGDGVNDAPALAAADVGLAIGAGTDVAIESAGIILAGSDPRTVVSTIELSRATYRRSLQNLWWAAGYNVLAIPLAAGAMQWAGITLSPAAGAVLMSLSTIVVALNAQLLRRVDLRPGGAGGPRPDDRWRSGH